MFGTSGIRGIYGKEITEELAMRIANIFASDALAVGRDTRVSGPALRDAVANGVLAAGADFIDLGIVPTPTVALANRKHGCRAIMITASHNPPEYNGLKLMENTKEIGKELEKEITASYRKGESALKRAEVAGKKKHDEAILADHRNLVMGLVDGGLIGKRKPKIVVDCNGAAAVITPALLTELGCRVIPVNCGLEGFARPPEPNRKNLGHLPALVKETGADFAIAHDGDGDRCVIFDETGAMLEFDAQLAMMIEHELDRSGAKEKNKKIVTTVEASLAIRGVVEKVGGAIDITPVGSTFVADRMEADNGLFGGEPCGEYIYRDGVHVPDAVLAAAKFAEIFCQKGPFSKLKTRYPQHFMAREKFQAKDKHGTVIHVKEGIAALGIQGKVRDDDGIRVDEEDGWFLVRASGTEPIVRLTMEYMTREGLEKRKNEMELLIKRSLV